MENINDNWRLVGLNKIMELIFIYNGSSMELSNDQNTKLKTLYSCLTESGKEYIQIWSEENSYKLPQYLFN